LLTVLALVPHRPVALMARRLVWATVPVLVLVPVPQQALVLPVLRPPQVQLARRIAWLAVS
jgi:hypothetical protein